MKKTYITILALLVTAGILAISGCTSNTQNQTPPINVADVQVKSSGYGMYDVTGSLTPSKDYSYLEMVLKWYDAQGNVIDRTTLAWNINEAKAGETIKFDAKALLQQGTTPAKVDIMIFDSPFGGGDESEAIYKQTFTIG